jgi:hypothetical protein
MTFPHGLALLNWQKQLRNSLLQKITLKANLGATVTIEGQNRHQSHRFPGTGMRRAPTDE